MFPNGDRNDLFCSVMLECSEIPTLWEEFLVKLGVAPSHWHSRATRPLIDVQVGFEGHFHLAILGNWFGASGGLCAVRAQLWSDAICGSLVSVAGCRGRSCRFRGKATGRQHQPTTRPEANPSVPSDPLYLAWPDRLPSLETWNFPRSLPTYILLSYYLHRLFVFRSGHRGLGGECPVPDKHSRALFYLADKNLDVTRSDSSALSLRKPRQDPLQPRCTI